MKDLEAFNNFLSWEVKNIPRSLSPNHHMCEKLYNWLYKNRTNTLHVNGKYYYLNYVRYNHMNDTGDYMQVIETRIKKLK